MGWFNILKFHPELKRLLENMPSGDKLYNGFLTNDEEELRDMWDSSNPDNPYESRAQKGIQSFYPIDEWYGVIVEEENKARLVAISGFTIKAGKDGKKYAIVGGTRRSKGNNYRNFGRLAKNKPTQLTKQYSRIVGYSSEQGSKVYSGQFNEKPVSTHAVVPDEVLGQFSEKYGDSWGVGNSINTLDYWNEDWD